MRQSPRERRLISDYESLVQLQRESTIFSFAARGPIPEVYEIRFNGLGLWRLPDGSVTRRDEHEVRIELGAAYPRMMPTLNWQTPIYHPNISTGGVVCLGGYGTHWVPSLRLAELCQMLWDMIRYKNYDIKSPYNRDAALWASTQTQFRLPVDSRCIRDIVSGETLVAAQSVQVQNTIPPPIQYTQSRSSLLPRLVHTLFGRPTADSGTTRNGAVSPSPPAEEIIYID